MIKKRVEKKISLSAFFKDVFVCERNYRRPYMEIFVQEPENVAQQKLGTIGGILEIMDESEDSSYIVNYLISVIKKEYYSKIKRGTIESFEAALHKANLALAKLAEHGNIGWIGKINAAVFAIEKNNVHLSKTGTARVFMRRQKTFTDICEDFEIPPLPNPLKTFTDVLSGKIEKNDCLIFTTDSIFQIFSFDEIKKNAIKFSFSDFSRFLKTALSNKLSEAAVLLSEIQEKTEEIVEFSGPAQKVNAWSQVSFKKPHHPRLAPEEKNIDTLEKENITEVLRTEMEKSEGDFIDKKTGHIYIKEDAYSSSLPPVSKFSLFKDIFKDFKDKVIKFLKSAGRYIISLLPFKYVRNGQQTYDSLAKINDSADSVDTVDTIDADEVKIERRRIDYFRAILAWLTWLQLIFYKFGYFLADLAEKLVRKFRKTSDFSEKIAKLQPTTTLRGVISNEVLPSFKKISSIFSRLDKRQKLYALAAVILILVVPYFIAKIGKTKNIEPQAAAPAANLTPRVLPVADEINAVAVKDKNPAEIYTGSFSQIINVNGIFFAIGKNTIANLESKTGFAVPESFGEVKASAGMDNLNLIFIVNEQKKILAWSPISKKFQENNLNLPENAEITGLDCYLTYLYVLDAKNSAIYRFPRAEGGFGAYASWLRDNFDLNQTRVISVDENIFLAGGNNIHKFFKNRRLEWTPEVPKIGLSAVSIYAKSANVYVLDSDNARIIRYGQDGKILVQYYGQDLKNATGLTADENAGLIYFSSPSGIKSFKI